MHLKENYFVDRMIPFASINQQILPYSEAKIPISDRGLRFGDGVFETIRLTRGIPYQWELHLKRLEKGLETLSISYDTKNLLTQSLLLIKHNNISEGTLRIMITRGQGGKGYLPAPDAIPTVIIETIERDNTITNTGSLFRTKWTKPSFQSLPSEVKLMQGLNATLAKMQAHAHHCTEALMLSDDGIICEASSGNIFWVKDDIIFTPSKDCPMVCGTMRDAVIRLSPTPIVQECFSLDTLVHADEVFLTNATWPVLSITDLLPENIRYSQGAVAKTMNNPIPKDMQHYADAWPLTLA
jgi:aminodeoxychorismate lyase